MTTRTRTKRMARATVNTHAPGATGRSVCGDGGPLAAGRSEATCPECIQIMTECERVIAFAAALPARLDPREAVRVLLDEFRLRELREVVRDDAKADPTYSGLSAAHPRVVLFERVLRSLEEFAL